MSDTSELQTLTEQLDKGRVLCVGDVMLDRFVEGCVTRISPEGPIPVLAVERESAMLGGAGNVVRNLSSFGASVELVAVVGVDAAGDEIAALLKAEARAQTHLLQIAGRKTSIKTRYLAGGQQLLRADRESCEELSAADCDRLVSAAKSALGACKVMVISDYGKGILSDAVLERLIALGRGAGIPVIVDPKGNDYTRYRGASLLTPNRHELAKATGQSTDNDEAVNSACDMLIERCGVDGVLATRGEDGATLVHSGGVFRLAARHPREVFDVSGAGDTVVAALAAGLAAGATLEVAAELANTAAGVVVGKVGTAVAWPSEIRAALSETDFLGGDNKIVTLELASERVATWRRQGHKVGFTNGCFDVLHPGHVSLFEQARGACDRLVVALNSDASVTELKGAARPLQSEASRAAVLASLAAVDLVVVFAEDTPIILIEALQPDVLVKGADYSIDDVVGAAEVRSWGGSVLLAELAEGHSTTNVIQKIAP
jgi:D-beta-D-heptose 7-phosphate kinase / D-beta-D-heptose 1-phosphate adenosyltransferase